MRLRLLLVIIFVIRSIAIASAEDSQDPSKILSRALTDPKTIFLIVKDITKKSSTLSRMAKTSQAPNIEEDPASYLFVNKALSVVSIKRNICNHPSMPKEVVVLNSEITPSVIFHDDEESTATITPPIFNSKNDWFLVISPLTQTDSKTNDFLSLMYKKKVFEVGKVFEPFEGGAMFRIDSKKFKPLSGETTVNNLFLSDLSQLCSFHLSPKTLNVAQLQLISGKMKSSLGKAIADKLAKINLP